MSDKNEFMNGIVENVFKGMAYEAIKSVIGDERGRGIETEIKEEIKAEAKRLIKEDEEIKKRIRDALLFWISKQ